MPLWAYLVAGIALAISGFGTGWEVREWKYGSDLAAKTMAARAQEQATARTTFRLQEVRDADSIRVNDLLADALQRLRNRPDRMPSAATPACAGATGAQLSEPDGRFLSREAARADQLRVDLETCRGWIEAVTKGQK